MRGSENLDGRTPVRLSSSPDVKISPCGGLSPTKHSGPLDFLMTRLNHTLPLILLTAVLAACGTPQALTHQDRVSGALSAPADRTLNLSAGQSRPLALNVDGHAASPADVAWTSSNPDVASVDLGGTVTGVAAGEATVKASLRGDPTVSLTYTLDVTAAPGGGGSYERRVLDLVNQAREHARNCGTTAYAPASPVTWSTVLGSEAEAYSRDMAARGYFGHTSPEGRTLTDRLKLAGYADARAEAENIAGGQPTPEAVVQNWLLSPTHCANIMNPAFKEMGVGYVKGGAYQHYWTQTFASH